MLSDVKMADVEDDDISLTSTVTSEQKSEYEVETILAEQEFPECVKYLVKWADYPVERATWEPQDMFSTNETLIEWKKKKKAIEQGRISKFDVMAWERHVTAIWDAANERKRRRNMKRKRLGLATSGEQGLSNPSTSHTILSNNPDGRTPESPIAPAQDHLTQNKETSNNLPSQRPIQAASNPAAPSHASNSFDGRTRHVAKRTVSTIPASSSRRIGQVLFARQKRAVAGQPSSEAPKFFSLSTKRRYEKAKWDEPAPDINQLELMHPSEWTTGGPNKKGKDPLRHRAGSDNELFVPSHDMQVAPGHPPTSEHPVTSQNDMSQIDTPPNHSSRSFPRQIPGNNTPLHLRITPNTSSGPATTLSLEPSKTGSPTSRVSLSERSMSSALDHTHDSPASISAPLAPKGYNRQVRIKTLEGFRFIERGDVLVDMYYGPDRTKIGTVRICGTIPMVKSKLIEAKQDHNINVWFQRTCSIDEYGILCQRVADNVKYCNGWVEGFSDTEDALGGMAQELRSGDIAAIYYPENQSHHVLVAYWPDSKDFSFLNGNFAGHHWPPARATLSIAVRSTLGPIERLIGVQQERFLRASVVRSANATQPSNEIVPQSTNAPRSFGAPQPANVHPPDTSTQATNTLQPTKFPQSDTAPQSIDPYSANTHQSVSTTQPSNIPKLASDLRPPEVTQPTNLPQTTETQISRPLSPTQNEESTERVDEPQDVEQSTTFEDDSAPMDLSDTPPGSLDVNDVFKSRFSITFDELTTLNGEKDKANAFYLLFPTEDSVTQAEYQLITQFLKHNKAIIFSNHIPEDWERFAQTITRGVVLLHGDFVNYYELPFLRELLRKPVNFWSVSLRCPLEWPGHGTYFQRLFPHGGVILLTEDFMTREQDATIIILKWFVKWNKAKWPGSWKIMLRPDVQNWLLEKDSSEDNADGRWLLMYSLIQELIPIVRLGDPADIDLEGLYDELAPNSVISPPKLPQYGSRTEEDNPEIPKGLSQNQRNTDHLVEYFAGWSLLTCHRFRKFVVGISYPKPLERWEAWNHLEFRCGARDIFKIFDIDYKTIWKEIVTAPNKSRSSTKQPPTASSSTASTPNRDPKDQQPPSLPTYTPRTPKTISWATDENTSSSSRQLPPQQPSSIYKYPQPYQ